MPVSPVKRPVSVLRQRMLEDMSMRFLRSTTQRDYIRFVQSFSTKRRNSAPKWLTTPAGSAARIVRPAGVTHRSRR